MDPNTNKFYCVCCGFASLDEQGGTGSYELCPFCFWEDDKTQFEDPTYEGGANQPSLQQAKKNFQTFGACDEKAKSNVKPPGDTPRDPNYVEPE